MKKEMSEELDDLVYNFNNGLINVNNFINLKIYKEGSFNMIVNHFGIHVFLSLIDKASLIASCFNVVLFLRAFLAIEAALSYPILD